MLQKSLLKETANQQNGYGDSRKNLFNEIQNILIVNKFNVTPINLLFLVLFLLHFENMLQNTYSNIARAQVKRIEISLFVRIELNIL